MICVMYRNFPAYDGDNDHDDDDDGDDKDDDNDDNLTVEPVLSSR